MTVHIDIGGEGRYPGAFNVNPVTWSSAAETFGEPIPRLVQARGEALPFASGIADLITIESTPLRLGAYAELNRVLKPGGILQMLHPTEYAMGAGIHDAVASAAGLELVARSTVLDGIATLSTLRRALNAIR